MTVVQHALAYAAGGWPVFPCDPETKRPLVEHGFKAATTDVGVIGQWWRQWPHAMIGAPTGWVMGGGHFVIDIDPLDGQTADAIVTALAARLGTLPPCPMVRTPRGGLHLYFQLPPTVDIGNRAHVIPGVDVRGNGGYVILPPSVRQGAAAKADGCDGVAYAWEEDHAPADISPPLPSEGVIDFVLHHRERAAQTPPPPSAGGVVNVYDDAVRRYALMALGNETREVAGAGKGTRNDRLNKAALALGQLVAAGALNEQAVISELVAAARASGLVRDDGINSVMATIQSGLKAGRASPRDLSDIGKPRRREMPPWPDGGDGVPPIPPAGGGATDRHDDTPKETKADRLRKTIEECAVQPLNDTGNGQRLRLHFGQEFLFVRNVGAHVWVGSHWEREGADEHLIRLAQETAARIHWEARAIYHSKEELEAIATADAVITAVPDPAKRSEEQRAMVAAAAAVRERLVRAQTARHKFAVASGNASKISAMIAMATAHVTVAPDLMDSDPAAVNVQNGTLRVIKIEEPDPECPDPYVTRYRTSWRVQLNDHKREDRFTKVMPVKYDPDAKCPRWMEFMERFQPNPNVRRFLQTFHGYALTGFTGEQIFVFNYGLGANGKSTFMETLARLMGGYAQVLPSEALTGDLQRRGDQATPEFARLPGARLVRCAELPRGQSLRESVLKLLTGGEPILVRHLHQGFFEFRPTFKAIGSGNDKPPIGGVDEGIWRRMRLVPWEVTIPPEERRPMEKVLAEFAEESSGILNWLIEGVLDYLENGLVVPPEISVATNDYRSAMDPVGEFTESCVVQVFGQDVTARAMYQAYVAWCHANSVRAYSERAFAGIMTQKGFKKENGRIRKYVNVQLRDVPPDPDALGGGGWHDPPD